MCAAIDGIDIFLAIVDIAYLISSAFTIVRQRRPVELTAEQGAVRERFFARSRHSSF
jgi:hypothetical protein